jgi:hypothetical protein
MRYISSFLNIFLNIFKTEFLGINSEEQGRMPYFAKISLAIYRSSDGYVIRLSSIGR